MMTMTTISRHGGHSGDRTIRRSHPRTRISGRPVRPPSRSSTPMVGPRRMAMSTQCTTERIYLLCPQSPHNTPRPCRRRAGGRPRQTLRGCVRPEESCHHRRLLPRSPVIPCTARNQRRRVRCPQSPPAAVHPNPSSWPPLRPPYQLLCRHCRPHGRSRVHSQ
jgi:hypothetical protein